MIGYLGLKRPPRGFTTAEPYNPPDFADNTWRLTSDRSLAIIVDHDHALSLGTQVELPLYALGWLTNSIRRILLPESEGGLPADSSRCQWDGYEVLILRRSFNCMGPGELGYMLHNMSRTPYLGMMGQFMQLPDRLVFNTPFYQDLIDLAEQAAAKGLCPAPHPDCHTIRPLWLGPAGSEPPAFPLGGEG